MPQFLSEDLLVAAVDRLGHSRANQRLADFLIIKRAIALSVAAGHSPTVKLSTRDAVFRQAIDELMATSPAGAAAVPDDLPPLINVFGTAGHGNRGHRTQKYYSNGTAVTVPRWPFIETLQHGPRKIRLAADYLDRVEDHLLVAQGNERPSIVDFACWHFRFDDLEGEGAVPDPSVLVERIKTLYGLVDAEIAALFEPVADEAVLTFQDEAVDAHAYVRGVAPAPTPPVAAAGQDLTAPVEQLVSAVEAAGFTFHPWQIAAFVTAVVTKPFVVLAGISGTGKTKLPKLVARAAEAEFARVAVNPDWTDGSDLVGFRSLDGSFQPGPLLQSFRAAGDKPDGFHFLLLDEMNLARPEYYLADYISHVEERERAPDGSILTPRAAPHATTDVEGFDWSTVRLPPNFCLVGSVNMDETTHGFSRKVLDRAFVLEFSDVDLTWIGTALASNPTHWPVAQWTSPWLRITEIPDRDDPVVSKAIAVLGRVNEALQPAQQHVGYRVRDEIVMFCLNAKRCQASFRWQDSTEVDALDLALHMKVLPRLQGGSGVLGDALGALASIFADVDGQGHNLPLCEERVQVMLERLKTDDFASFWI